MHCIYELQKKFPNIKVITSFTPKHWLKYMDRTNRWLTTLNILINCYQSITAGVECEAISWTCVKLPITQRKACFRTLYIELYSQYYTYKYVVVLFFQSWARYMYVYVYLYRLFSLELPRSQLILPKRVLQE